MSRRHPRGYSLIESLVVISLLGFLLGMVTLTLHSMLRGEIGIRDEITQEMSLDRLASLLRSDIHRATEVNVDPSQDRPLATTMKLDPDQSQHIEYSFAAGELVRLQRTGGEISQRDTFLIPFSSDPTWQVDRRPNGTLVTLWLHPGQRRTTRSGEIRICAVLGLERTK